MKKKKLLKKLLPIVVIITLVIITINIFSKKRTIKINMTPELSRTQVYDEVEIGDEVVFDENNNEIAAIQFDAFFLKDKDGDGTADAIRGTCNEIGSDANLYMDLKVIEEGQLKNATITINSNNFYFNTSIVKDNLIASNYISSNTKTIKFNDMGNGSQALLIGAVRSGDYSSTSGKTVAIGNDTSKYSMENSVNFSGTYVDSEGNEKNFTKTVPFVVDWYGKVNCEITPKAQTVTTSDFNNLVSDDGLTLQFSINTTETENQLIMSESLLSGTIPELNGYKPTSVKISGANVTYKYDAETGEFTSKREAILNDAGIVTSNAYTSSNSGKKNNTYNFTIVYPIEAYQEIGEDVTSFELAIPVEAINKGYNNQNTEDGFENPYTSNTATGIVVTTWKLPSTQNSNPSFDIYVGTYMGTPYNTYVISKKKPINIYNGISLEEKDDTYLVQWRAYTGTNGITDGIIMKETEGKNDSFLNTSGTYISMDELTTNKGIYFNGATETLGTDGWIKIYDADTNALIETFTSSKWSKYSASNPYIYENKIKHIRVETSNTNALSYFYAYNVKELDDEYITENFTRGEFDNLSFIYSYLDGYMLEKTDDSNISTESGDTKYWYKKSTYNKALYAAPTSIASISIKENTISTKATAENEKITIKTETSGYNEQGWKNGMFLVKLPSDIIYAEINSVTVNNSNVTVSAYDIYEENGNYYIKILTENTEEETYSIVVDCNLTPDPRIPKKTETIELYAINEIASDYYYSGEDTCDIDGDSNVTEKVNYRKISLTMDPGTSLTTTQYASNYGEEDGITIAPRVAKTDKDQRTATITILSTNNYSYDLQDIKIQGVVPFEGNDYVISGKDLNSAFTTYMSDRGITVVTEGLGDYVTIYYSTTENPTNDLNDKANGWTLAENIEDWSKVKTYLIVIDNSYKLATGEKIEFQYEISLPQGVDYNEVTYAAHAIYFALATDEGLYYTSTGSEKLGFMIAKQYDLEIIKYQEDTDKTLQGVTFTLTEDGQDTSTIKVTDANGAIKFTGLYVERYYTLKEQKVTDDYVLNSEEIKFYTYTEINEDDTESLYIVHVNDDGTYSKLSDVYTSVKEDTIISPNEKSQEDYRIQIRIENEVKAKLAINKKDKSTGEALKNIKFTITGEGKDGEVSRTDASGNINISGLYLEHEYTLTEVKATGYYIPQTPIKFTIINNNGKFELNYTDNGTTATKEITVDNEIPTINLNLENEKIPTYGLQLTKYAKDEKVTDEKGNLIDKVLKKAQYKIYGDGISADGMIYTTDENGIITIDDLYEYVEGKYITGEYTISEIYAPEGYKLNSTPLKFKTYRENGTLKIQILEGEDVIRLIKTTQTDETTGENVTNTHTDLNIADADGTYPVIKIGVEDGPIFSLFKYSEDGTTSEKIPIPGTKFKITDLDGNYVTGSDGQIVGEWFDTTEEQLPVPNITLSSTSTYKWTQRDDGTWESTGNHNIDDSTSTLTSNEFELLQDASLKFDWSVSCQSGYYDYLYFTITNTLTGKTIGGTNTAIGGTSYGTVYESLNFKNMSIDLKAGTYKIEFVYSKNNANSNGLDAGFVKNVRLEAKQIVQTGCYAVTTDELGTIKANLPEGLYKAVEISTDNKYILPENEADRTYYFGIGASQAATWDWVNAMIGHGWNYINSVDDTKDGGVVGVGSFSEYSNSINTVAEDGIDLNKDGTVDKLSQGNNDGILINYDEDGNYVWAKSYGGNDDDAFNKVIQTSDGGYAVVGYVASSTVQIDGTQEITDLTKSETETNLANKDAVLLKLDSGGNCEWAVRFGGTADDEIKSVIETSEGNLVVVGSYYSSTFNFYDAGVQNNVVDSFTKSNIYTIENTCIGGFLASYSSTGKYQWSQRIAGFTDTEAVDVTETTKGIAIAINYQYEVYLDTAKTVSEKGNEGYTNGIVVGYNLDGTYSWKYRFYYGDDSTENAGISALGTGKDDNIIVAVNYAGTLYGSSNEETPITIAIANGYLFDGAIIQLSNDGTYNKNLYTVTGNTVDENYDDYISDIKVTSDGGVLLGGWYYSESGIDVDGDGQTTGKYDFPEISGQYTSDGFVIKIDGNGQVNYASRLYGDGYDGVTSVCQTKSRNFVAGGYFNSSTFSATNCKITKNGETDETEVLLNRVGNSEGFVIAVGAEGAAVAPEAQTIEVENEIKTFKITTEVKKHIENISEVETEVAGGDIDGEEGTFGGIEYSKDGIRYVEKVEYGEDSSKQIKITPDSGYTISYITINNVEYNNFTTNDDGTVTLSIFENVTEDIHIVVEFSNAISSMEVNHYLWTAENGITTQKVAESEYYTGEVGATYTTTPKTDINYEIITNKDYYSGKTEDEIATELGYSNIEEAMEALGYYDSSDSQSDITQSFNKFLAEIYIPANYTGQYVDGQKEIVNYYYKEKTYTLTVHHYIDGTNEAVPKKGSETGEKVEDEIQEGLAKSSEYTTIQASEDLIDYSIYELVGTPENAKGRIEENTEVTYYYKIKTANITITKVAEEDHSITLSGTEFALYKLTIEDSSKKDELIDVTNVDSCWTLVNTYTSSSTGAIRLEDLPITTEYRLVETKATDDRMIPDGQWKIEFVYGQYDEADASIVTVNGTPLKISAIGNPPALAITDEGELELPNKEYYNFPTSGNSGIKKFYKIGFLIVAIGLVILFFRKRVVIVKK